MKKAYNYMFLDNQFSKKGILVLVYIILLIYCSIFSLTGFNGTIPLKFFNYIIITIIIFFGYSIFEGYKISVIKSINTRNENIQVLPILNIKKDFIVGIQYFISLLMISVPFFCVIGAFGFATSFSLMIFGASFPFYISSILLILSILVSVLYLICFLPASIAVFAKTNSIWSFYKFEEIFELVLINKKEYIKSALVYSILGLVIEECYRICLILNNQALILLLIILFIFGCIITYLAFVMCYAVANIRKDCPNSKDL